ncbi:MAG: hypothetical protein WA883_06020 [Phormidesmis sp.]
MPAKLVAIGDSVTEGFLNGSISKTCLSYPALIAECLEDSDFTLPDFSGAGGLPLNLEALLNHLDSHAKPDAASPDQAIQAQVIQQFMDTVEDYWERGDGAKPSDTGPLHRNLSVWGFQLPDCDTLSDKLSQQYIPLATDHPIAQQPEFALYRTARRTLNPSQCAQYESLTQLDVAEQIAQREGGIDNLIFWLGSNHCLDTVVRLSVEWSTAETMAQPLHLRTANLWRPEHFKQVLHRVADKVSALGARNVFIGNVPRVTIPPVSRGITPGAALGMGQDDNGYYEYYTHFWIRDSEFDPARHPHLTRSQIREIDSTIDEYNQIIQNEANYRGWHLVNTAQVLDKVAFRRQQGHSQYPFPPELVAALRANPKTKDRVTGDGDVLLDTRYYHIDPQAQAPSEKYKGGLFGLDGAHPTTVGYGIIAYEFLQVMQKVGCSQGKKTVAKPLDWAKIVASDTLLTEPPASLAVLPSILAVLFGQAAAPTSPESPARRSLSIPEIGLALPWPISNSVFKR